MRILVSGAAGTIGRVVVEALSAAGHEVVGFDVASPPDGVDVAWHQGDCTDPDAVESVFAAQPLDAVVHLAGHPDELDLPGSLTSHVFTTAALLDAMVAHRVTRFVYASSNHAVGRTPRVDRVGVDDRPRPDTFYGVGKVAAEAVMSLYADRYGIDAIACRIGSFLPEPLTRRHLATWLSPADCVRMVIAVLEAPAPGFAVLYGISANRDAWWDLEPGRALGYEPRDDAATYEDQIPHRADDDVEGMFVGGPFATERFHRPALDTP